MSSALLREIPLDRLQIDPITAIGNEWMLVTAGTQHSGYNTLTASWGHLGCLWNKPTAVAYIRPQRYTKQFIDREEYYTLSFFGPEQREALTYLGTHSGRDGDKVAAAGLTPVYGEGYTSFAQARLTLVCRKLYAAPLTQEGFVDRAVLDANYPARDLHTLYVGEIVKALQPAQA